ncbi:transposase [Cordyceps fumosorosea ARSEF 2679]|uniref:Transposase n=1 Tax=Cordyceps fumosorosea (strain ARSEF 2679) TaxID=1081104 RepID=A0A167M6Z7_CORFA|nr:transposase [Cordyceps fumosorosea ARSEF 2679]OAA54017.1 transposase [Cordyceps fumosorosea ARSEF 2679]
MASFSTTLSQTTMSQPPPPPPPRVANNPRMASSSKHLTQEQRQRIRVLHFDAHMGPAQISRITGDTMRQVKYAIRAQTAVPLHRSGRPQSMTPAEVDALLAYMASSKAAMQMSYQELSKSFLDGRFSQWVIRRMLYQQGLRRRVAAPKTPRSRGRQAETSDGPEPDRSQEAETSDGAETPQSQEPERSSTPELPESQHAETNNDPEPHGSQQTESARE